MTVSYRVVRWDPSGGIHSVVATFATRDAAEVCAAALTRFLDGEEYGVVLIEYGRGPQNSS